MWQKVMKHPFSTVIPYRRVIDIKGATAVMQAAVEISVDHVSFNMLSGHEVELRFQLSFNANLVEEQEVYVINHITFDDMNLEELDKTTIMTVYIVQRGYALGDSKEV